MNVSSTSSSSSTATSSNSASSTTNMGKEDFLLLFTAQLKAQDPLNPMDATDMTAQLAQFSSLEQLTNINSTLSSMLTYQSTAQSSLATSMIGKDVVVAGDTVSLSGGSGAINYSLGSDAASVTLSLYDSTGTLVNTTELTNEAAGSHSVTWNGQDANGVTLADGSYTVAITAKDTAGAAVTATSLVTGTVTGVTFNNNTAYLVINGSIQAELNNVYEIQGGN